MNINSVMAGARTVIFKMGKKVAGVPTNFFEDVAVDSKGIVYVAEGSTKWQQRYTSYNVLEAGAYGRYTTSPRASTRRHTIGRTNKMIESLSE